MSFSLRQAGQYQGAGVFTGLGLRLRHLAQRNRLPFTAVFGRVLFPVLGKFFVIGTPVCHLSGLTSATANAIFWFSRGPMFVNM